MTDGADQELLAQLLARVEQLEATNEELRRELQGGRRTPSAGGPADEAVSRRGMLKKAGGALAAGVAGAGALGALGAAPAAAADGQPVILGSYDNKATQSTSILNGENDVYLNSVGPAGYGMLTRVYDFYGAGVIAYVYGKEARGLEGVTSGRADQTAVMADASKGGTGLQVKGPAKFSASGLAVFAKGQATKTISATIRETSLVLATAQGDLSGVWVQSVHRQVANRRFVIRLNKAAPAELKVGWFVVN
jgi:hypothetical protein